VASFQTFPLRNSLLHTYTQSSVIRPSSALFSPTHPPRLPLQDPTSFRPPVLHSISISSTLSHRRKIRNSFVKQITHASPALLLAFEESRKKRSKKESHIKSQASHNNNNKMALIRRSSPASDKTATSNDSQVSWEDKNAIVYDVYEQTLATLSKDDVPGLYFPSPFPLLPIPCI